MKKLLITSHTDLDGCGCVILAKYYQDLLGFDQVDYTMNNYEDESYPYETLHTYSDIWYIDFSPDERCREIIQKSNVNVIIFDHHDSVFEDLTNWDYTNKVYYYAIESCGTKIFYEFLISHFKVTTNVCIDQFVGLVNIYDLWQKTSDKWISAQDLNRLLFKVCDYVKSGIGKYELFFSMMIHKFDYDDTFSFSRLEQDKIIADKKREEEMFNDLIKNPAKTIKTRKDSKGRHFCVIKLSSKISTICNRLLEKYSKLDYVIALNTYSKSNYSISLRSREGINLLEYADVKGHECSAGLENSNQEIFDDLWTGKKYMLEVLDTK